MTTAALAVLALSPLVPALRGQTGAAERPATLAVVNARVWTGHPQRPRATALAVVKERIAAVGTEAEIRSIVSPSTRILDAHGHTVLPGFVDAHFHILDLEEHAPLTLYFVTSREELAREVARAAAELPPGSWVLGHGWDERKWGGEAPSKAWIDGVSPRNPVWLTRAHGACGLANSLALKAAGIGVTAVEADQAGVIRDRAGRPNGLVRGAAIDRLDAVLLEPERPRAELAVARLTDELLARGVTSVHHSGNWKELLILDRLRREGRLRVRVYAAVPLPAWDRLREFVDLHGRGDSWLHWDGLKLFRHDWTTRAHPTKNGRLDRFAVQPTAEEAYGWFAGATRARLQIMVHAGGIAHLRFFDRVRRELRPDDARFRIEHAHDVSPEETALYARAGVIASVQPPLLWHTDSRTKAGLPPPKHFFPCREMLEAGVKVVFGTDAITAAPVTSPFESIRLAMERPGPDGRRLELEDALRAHTVDAAWAERREQEKGSLEPRKLADFVLLDRDLFASEGPVSNAAVTMTVVGGQVAYER